MASPDPATAVSPSDRLERIPVLTRSHRVWMVMLALLLFFDMGDLNAFAYAAPAVREEWGLSVGQVGLITSMSFLGMFFGSIVGGRLGDRFGRKRLIIGATIFYSVCSLASAFAVGVVDLSVYRVLTGFGLQAMTVVLITYISEMFPRRSRGRVQALILAFSLLGIPAMAGFARVVIPLGTGAWRWIFVMGAAGLALALAATRVLPESVRWNSANGRGELSDRLVAELEADARRRTGEELPPVETQPAPLGAAAREIFRSPFGKRVLVLGIYMGLVIAVFYGFTAWMPTLLVEKGYSTAGSLSFVSIIALAAGPGALVATTFIDRVERRTAMMCICILSGALMLTFAYVDSYGVLLVAGFLLMLILHAGTACVYTYLPEIFPTRLRGLGAGIGNGTGRLATFASSFLIASLLGTLGSGSVFLGLAAVNVLAGLIIGIFGERTRDRSLEVISEAADVVSVDPSASEARSRS